MRHGSLFSGIGGFDLAAEWMGWENVFHCEWNKFGQQVLKYYWPKAISYEDITKTDFTIHRGRIDILTGGFPCQPYSSAGKRLGKEDERHLWPQMLRAIKEIQPRWIVGENVLGITNWNGGLVFEEIQVDLENQGYKVQAYVLPAVSVNAPHRRDRVWFVAHSTRASERANQLPGLRCKEGETRREGSKPTNESQANGNDANTDSTMLEHGDGEGETGGRANKKIRTEPFDSPGDWTAFPTVSPLRMRDDGVSSKLLRFVVNELYDKISNTSEENRIQNLQEVWQSVQSEEIWEQVRGLYSLESKDVLLQTMQLYSPERAKQRELSPFSEELCQPILQHLSKYKEFRCSPQGQELEKQRFEQFGDSLSFLPHEIALAARRFEAAISKFESWHRKESIKAGGNAIVPQVVYQIFKTIEQYENLPNL